MQRLALFQLRDSGAQTNDFVLGIVDLGQALIERLNAALAVSSRVPFLKQTLFQQTLALLQAARVTGTVGKIDEGMVLFMVST